MRPQFDSWIRKICWRRDRLPTPVFLGFPCGSAGKESACRRPQFDSWVRKVPWRRDRLPTPVFLGFLGDSDDKESSCNVGDLGSILGLGRSPGGGPGNPFQYSCLENPHGQRRLAGYCPWSHKESDMTERLSTEQHSLYGKFHKLQWINIT